MQTKIVLKILTKTGVLSKFVECHFEGIYLKIAVVTCSLACIGSLAPGRFALKLGNNFAPAQFEESTKGFRIGFQTNLNKIRIFCICNWLQPRDLAFTRPHSVWCGSLEREVPAQLSSK
ncbi:hypothetical protein AVEN_229016-1 [Araneus ventricosus]|uniref:Uncharacterized protein n=1 Tax=Araneus ventricosus TaxID=182803 RepID=A0A4Y2KPJ3_ARAVE|nr:hypothetical protein AVEN_229016-1 [Araneus ventricosus]